MKFSHNFLDAKESAEAAIDIRKKFFYSILHSSGKPNTVESTKTEQASLDLKKRSRSESDLDQSVDGTDEGIRAANSDNTVEVPRARSASPTVKIQSVNQEEGEEAEDAGRIEESDDADVRSKSVNEVHDEQYDIKEAATDLNSAKAVQRHHSEDGADESKTVSRSEQPTMSKPLDYDISESTKMKTTFIGSHVPDDDNEKEEERPIDAASSPSTPKGKCRPYIDIPEFTWSSLHQRLLSELLFSIESDLQVWKT